MWGAAIFVLIYFFFISVITLVRNSLERPTPGKRKAGIRVIKDSGRPLTPAETIGRHLMRIVDWLPFFYGVGMVSAFLTRGNSG